MAKHVYEGEKRLIGAGIKRTSGSGAINVTLPQYRILDANKAAITGYDTWQACTWDSVNSKIVALFDSTVAALSAPATYYMQLRGVIDNELYAAQVTVIVKEWGP